MQRLDELITFVMGGSNRALLVRLRAEWVGSPCAWREAGSPSACCCSWAGPRPRRTERIAYFRLQCGRPAHDHLCPLTSEQSGRGSDMRMLRAALLVVLTLSLPMAAGAHSPGEVFRKVTPSVVVIHA